MVKTIMFVSIDDAYPSDCWCNKSTPEKIALLIKNLAEYLKERDDSEFPKVSSVRGSAVYLHPPRY